MILHLMGSIGGVLYWPAIGTNYGPQVGVYFGVYVAAIGLGLKRT